LIVLSERFFTFWQDRYWKEAGNAQCSKKSIRANRYGAGLGSVFFGLAVMYIVLRVGW
jgi:hypothetical protein